MVTFPPHEVLIQEACGPLMTPWYPALRIWRLFPGLAVVGAGDLFLGYQSTGFGARVKGRGGRVVQHQATIEGWTHGRTTGHN